MAFKGKIPEITNPRKIQKFDNGHWLFPEGMGNDKEGFVYVIRDKILERFYLGKKTYFVKSKTIKRSESNWRNYISSSKLLKIMFEERPKKEFDFICLEEYKFRGALSYAETWTLCKVEAPTTSIWYNTRIEKVSWPVKENITDRHKERLEKAINMEEFDEF